MLQHPAPLMKCFFIMNIASIFYAISASSWLGVWVGMELNLYTFIFMLLLCPTPSHSQNMINPALVYFLVQAISSLLLIFSVVLLMGSYSNFFFYFFFLQASLMMKLGAAPFHFWVPWTVTNNSWPMTFWLLTAQKLAPLLMIYNISTLLSGSLFVTFFVLVIALSALLGGILGLFQTRLQPLLAYSSINQTAWLILAANYSFYLMFLYFVLYSMIMFLICSLMIKNHSLSLHLIPVFLELLPSYKLGLFFGFMILSGLPPTVIFFLKLNLFFFIFTRPEFLWLMPFLILGALLSMFYYLQFMIFLLLPSLALPKTTLLRLFSKLTALSVGLFVSGPVFLLLSYI